MSRGFLLDTNHLSQALRVDSIVWRRMVDLRKRGTKVGTCVPVLCEVEAGITGLREPAEYREGLERVLRQVRVWPIDPMTARLYGAVYAELRRRGRALSQGDMILAALARQMTLTLVTSDGDFAAVPDVATEDWLRGQS